MNLQQAVSQFKILIENAIITGGTDGKNKLIKSSKPINLIHEAVKDSLVTNGVSKLNIHPKIGHSKGELPVFGFLKKKMQDICVTSKNDVPTPEKVILGKRDKFGKLYTSKILSINVRSQLSSAAKNFDTLYERTFAEALNLHERCSDMVLGEVYMIAIREYDIAQSDNNIVSFKPKDNNIKNHVEKYIQYFDMLNNRASINDDKHKYERIALILVDFSQDPPRIYENNADLIKDGFLDKKSKADIKDLSFSSIIPTILNIYCSRHGANNLN